MNRYFLLIFIDALATVFALYASFLLRFDFSFPSEYKDIFFQWVPIFALSQALVFYFSGLYARLWRYTSLFDLYAILSAIITSFGLSFTVVIIKIGTLGYPRSVLLLYLLIECVLVIGSRLSVRIYFSHYHKNAKLKLTSKKKTLLLIGAGRTGEKIAREIRTASRHQYTLAGFLDDNIEKHDAMIHGKKVYGNIKDIKNLNIHFDEVLITAPSASGDQMREIVKSCKETGKRYRTVPGISELIDGEVSLDRVRDVSYADLLGREEVVLDMNSIEKLIRGKRILITGAGGSIGSELVRQCVNFSPAEIICLDFSEENIYKLEQACVRLQSQTVIKTVLASVNRFNQCEKVFIENQPQIVFHAAAYKHVPIQEIHPWAAVNTNIGGTLNIVMLSDKYKVDKFVLVSTDKAVNPANIMGASKRAAEKILQSFNPESDTTYMAVRFGNVLGSSGSAIPTFQKQINEGGPITITHPEMTRYFMSIQEASQLILQCGSLGKDGEIFLLEMGKPIKILGMAKDLIRLSGLEPEIDIPIVYTGLRPGEKLYEELQMLNEHKVSTSHKKIMILKENHPPVNWPIFLKITNRLLQSADNLNKEEIQTILKQLLPTYSPSSFNPVIEKKNIKYPFKAKA